MRLTSANYGINRIPLKYKKIKLLKTIDRFSGPFFIRLLPFLKKPRFRKPLPERIKNILLIRPGGVGDAVLLIPSIKIIKKHLPHSNIYVLAERRNAEVFKLCPEVERVFLYDKNMELLKSMRIPYDIVIDTEQWHRLSAVVSYLTGSPVRIGFGTNERKRLFSHSVPYSHDDYEVYSFFNLIKAAFKASGNNSAEPLVFNQEEPFLRLDSYDVSAQLRETIEGYLERFQKGYCVISPGATVPERRWGSERYAEVAQELLKKGYGVIVVGTKSDKVFAEKILSKAKDAMNLTGKTNIKEVAYVIKHARVFIGPDSGLLHIAFGLGTPTVSLFGAGIESKWAPRGKKHIVINKKLLCSPCTRFGYTPRCRVGVSCINEITPQDVTSATKLLLKGRQIEGYN